MNTRSRSSRLIISIFGTALLFAAQAALAINVSLALPPGAPTQLVLQPGESTTISIDFTNLDSFAGTGNGRALNGLVGLGSRWIITPVDFTFCGFPQPAEGLGIELPVELQPNQSLRCDYTLVRGPATYSDGYLTICTGPQSNPTTSCSQPAVLVIGTLPDVGVAISTVVPAAAITGEQTFRIDVSNAAVVPTAQSILYTYCRRLPGGQREYMPFVVDANFAGACPAATLRGCSFEPPLQDFSWEITIPSIPAGGSTSCLVKVRLRGPAGASVTDRFSSWLISPFFPGHPIPLMHQGALQFGGQGYDMNPSNNIANFTLAPAGTAAMPVPTENWRVLAALVLMLAVLGGHRLRRPD